MPSPSSWTRVGGVVLDGQIDQAKTKLSAALLFSFSARLLDAVRQHPSRPLVARHDDARAVHADAQGVHARRVPAGVRAHRQPAAPGG